MVGGFAKTSLQMRELSDVFRGLLWWSRELGATRLTESYL